MTADQFRRLALGLPEAAESSHVAHPDFRFRNRIFATLGYPDGRWGMVKLTPGQQAEVLRAAPEIFRPAAGSMGPQWQHDCAARRRHAGGPSSHPSERL